MSHFGEKLNPLRKMKEPLGVKGDRQTIVTTNNPSTIDQNQTLTVRFPNLGTSDVIVPGTARLAFKLNVESTTDATESAVVQNLGRAIIKKIVVKLEGQEILSIDDADIFFCYTDLWLTTRERQDLVYQGIQTIAQSKFRSHFKDIADPDEITLAYENRFYIPLDFELLTAHAPYFQGALSDRLSYELHFNTYDRIINSSDDKAIYQIDNISLEYDVVTHSELARMIRSQYESKTAIYYERVLRHSKIIKDKSDTVWNINLNTPSRSMKGILMLFEVPKNPYQRKSEKFYNPKITRVYTTIEGKPNNLFASGMLPYQQFDEIRKYLGGGRNRDPLTDLVTKQTHNHDVKLEEYLKNKYALWLDMRTTDDNSLHGSGRRLENGSEGITLQIEKLADGSGPVHVYVYVVSDAQMNIEGGRLRQVVF